MGAPLPVKIRGSAFTLIELTIVIVIISILSAVMIGEMSGSFQDALLRSTSRELISAFNLASTEAISFNRLHRVRLDPAAGRYVIEKHQRGDEFVPARNVIGSEGRLDPRISIQLREPEQELPDTETEPAPAERQPSSVEAINFYPDGTADSREVELRDREGFGLALRISEIDARVQIITLEHQ